MASRTAIIVIIFSTLAFVFGITSTAGKDWLHTNDYFQGGLLIPGTTASIWRSCTGKPIVCYANGLQRGWLKTVQALLVIGVILSLTSLLATIIIVFTTKKIKPIMAPILQFLTAGFVLVGLIVFIANKEGEEESSFIMFAWYGKAFYLSWAGWLFSMVAGCVGVCGCRCVNTSALAE